MESEFVYQELGRIIRLLERLEEKLERKMSAISNELAAISGSLTAIASGVTALDAAIQNFLNNTTSSLNAADQAALDAIRDQSAALATQASTVPGASPAKS